MRYINATTRSRQGEKVRALGTLIGIAGVLLGFWVGGYLLFWHGLVDGIEIIQNWSANQAEPTAIAWASVRVLFLGKLVGGLIAQAGIVIGGLMATAE